MVAAIYMPQLAQACGVKGASCDGHTPSHSFVAGHYVSPSGPAVRHPPCCPGLYCSADLYIHTRHGLFRDTPGAYTNGGIGSCDDTPPPRGARPRCGLCTIF